MVRDAAAALLLLCAVSAATVPPPADVTVSCHNLTTTVSWNHHETSKTRFLLSLMGSDGPEPKRLIETSASELDLTPYVWESAETCMDYYYVTVTATLDGNRSAPVKSRSFSFNELKTKDVSCLLELPPVQLAVRESGATVEFQNPLRVYKQLDQITKLRGDVSFQFTIQNETYVSCSDHVCTRDVRVLAGAKRCVTLEGRLCSRDCLGEVKFRRTSVCQDESSDSKLLTISLSLMLGVLSFVAAVITVFICKVRGWTMDKNQPQTPKVLVFEDEEKQAFVSPFTHAVEHTLLMTVMVPDCPNTKTDASEDDDLHLCPNASICSEDGYQDGGLSEDSNQGSGCSSERTETVSLNSEEDEAAGGYDRPHRLEDMGGGDMVTSYSR